MLGLATGITNTSYQWQPNFVGADLKLWLRNGVGVAVAQWDDSSGNGNHITQGTSGDQSALDGGGLHFEQSEGEHYDLTSNIAVASQEAFAIFIVMKVESYTTQNSLLGTGDTGVFLEFQTDRKIRLKTSAGTDVIQYDANIFVADEKMAVCITRTSGSTGEWKTYKNGSLLTEDSVPSGDGNNTGAFTFNTVANRSGDRFFDGTIYEMLVYDTTDLTDSEVSKISDYLNNKHNL